MTLRKAFDRVRQYLGFPSEDPPGASGPEIGPFTSAPPYDPEINDEKYKRHQKIAALERERELVTAALEAYKLPGGPFTITDPKITFENQAGRTDNEAGTRILSATITYPYRDHKGNVAFYPIDIKTTTHDFPEVSDHQRLITLADDHFRETVFPELQALKRFMEGIDQEPKSFLALNVIQQISKEGHFKPVAQNYDRVREIYKNGMASDIAQTFTNPVGPSRNKMNLG